MATYGHSIRRGLPRRPGGGPWPPDGLLPPGAETPQVKESAVPAAAPMAIPAATMTAPAVVSSPPVTVSSPAAETGTAKPATSAVRRGLPRTAGGDPWPPAGAGPVRETVAATGAVPSASKAATPAVVPAATTTEAGAPRHAVTAPVTMTAGDGPPLRRGLPRSPGAEPWPAAGTAPRSLPVEVPAPEVVMAGHVVSTKLAAPAVAEPAAPEVRPVPLLDARALRTARGFSLEPEPEPRRYGRFTAVQWAGLIIVGGGGLLFAAAMTVLAVRWFVSLDFMRDFLTTYPGEYHLPETAEPGFPAWVQWQHFFNTFFIVLIIRTGLQVRHDKRPTAFWTGRGKSAKKISLTLWLHQALDILWLVNGVIFVVLLFATGHWMRVVPTSWEVFPNAVSAVLQYVSLNWPTENGWVNYNSLQQIMYFLTVFVAAPLAAITGVRMSGAWPKNAPQLNRAYPIELARAIHFPTMLYFVGFIIIHVALVFATGALRNLNHMYGGTDVNWAGFWIFFAALLVIILGWIAARPMMVSPIAKLFGKVSAR